MPALKPLVLIRDAVRAKEILGTLVRYGFEQIVQNVEAPVGWIGKIVTVRTEPRSTWQRVRLACEDLGPTFVKVGQLLSTRPDLLPRALTEELKLLRNQVRPVPPESLRAVLEEELGGPVADFFAEFAEAPVACGSIAQVHRAVLKQGGAVVAVKVQRPGIEKSIAIDLEILGWLARELHARSDFLRPYELPSVVEELRQGLLLELDFSREARHAALFNARNPFPREVFAPQVLDDFTTRRLLVTEWIEGIAPDAVQLSLEDRRRLAAAGGRSLFHQVVINGFFHGDPHGGNLAVTPDGRLCFLDWGLVGQLTRLNRYVLADLFAAVLERDPETTARIALALSRDGRLLDAQRLEKEIAAALDRYGPNVAQEDVGRIIFDLLYVFGRNGIGVARDYTLLAKAILSISQTGRELDPGFDLQAVAEPFLKQLAWERWNPRSLLRQTFWRAQDTFRRLQELPGDFQRLIRRFEREDVRINLHHQGLDRFGDQALAAANRMVFAIIVGALIIGSSTVIQAKVPPFVWGSYPIIGVVGYLGSALLGLWIIFDIIRHGRHK